MNKIALPCRRAVKSHETPLTQAMTAAAKQIDHYGKWVTWVRKQGIGFSLSSRFARSIGVERPGKDLYNKLRETETP